MSSNTSNLSSYVDGILQELEQLKKDKQYHEEDKEQLQNARDAYEQQFKALETRIREHNERERIFNEESITKQNQWEQEWESELQDRRTKEAEEAKKRLEKDQERFNESIEVLKDTHHANMALIQSAFDHNKKIWEEEQERSRRELQDRLQAIVSNEADLTQKEDDLLREQERLRALEESILARIDVGIEERKNSFDTLETSYKEELNRLRDEVVNLQTELDSFESLDAQFDGKSAQEILKEVGDLRKLYENEKRKQRNEVSPEILEQWKEQQTRIEHLEATKKDLQAEKQELETSLQQKMDELAPLKRDLTELENLREHNARLQGQYDFIYEELKRLQTTRQSDLERWINDIESPSEQFENIVKPVFEEDLHEIDWLEQIYQDFLDYGFKWPKRILYAFHTSLKIRDWSPITVLAGVSGTGKSKLPQLYGHFGGINFYSVAVQPNWDSQQSMLGFFNSLENKFDATPMLKLLAQSQKPLSDDYPGLNQTQTIILLDEMNLAHIELYFADFLSKLEQRRGKSVDEPPIIEIQLGPGHTYKLPLGNNVLWTGTMNQDETTKSLSDKVLDRGVVIYFPRPKILERIIEQKPLPDPRKPLHRENFDAWTQEKSPFSGKQISDFKTLVEKINDNLANVGRALGHRVWQSIEHYMANHPKVIHAFNQLSDPTELSAELTTALKEAFEDQLVQKVMPKLRGIESRGQGWSECLEPIKNLLGDTNLIQDFDNACQTDFGQFMWRSAEYLNQEDTDELSTPPPSVKSSDSKNKPQQSTPSKQKEPLKEKPSSVSTSSRSTPISEPRDESKESRSRDDDSPPLDEASPESTPDVSGASSQFQNFLRGRKR